MSKLTAFAPASVANLSCGFDVLGLAIDKPGDEVSVSFNEEGSLRITSIKGDNGKLPYEIEKNTAGGAAKALLDHLNYKGKGIDIEIHKKMPFGSGLGSSAASAVAAVVAINALLNKPLSPLELVPFSMVGEAIASGSMHADNVAPSLLGGIVLIRGYEPLDIIQLPVPKNLYVAVIKPDVAILTQEARNILPKEVPMKSAITQSGNLAGLVASLYTEDLDLLSRSMVDVLAEPYRASLIPLYDNVKDAAKYGGALTFGISGSGPALFALCDSKARCEQIGDLMKRSFSRKKIETELYCSAVNTKGAYVYA